MKTLAILAFAFLLSTAIAAQVKTPESPAVKTPFTKSLQVFVVTTRDWEATSGNARLFERKSVKSKWKANDISFPVVIGRNGLAPTSENEWTSAAIPLKKEGDGKSPAGLFPLTFAFGVGEKISDTKLNYLQLVEFTECVDDVSSSKYNKIVNRMQVGNFDWNSSEQMSKIVPEYDLGVFVAYNSFEPVKGNGSCIFLHIWKDAESSTAGCTAMERANLESVIKWLDPAKSPYLVQMPQAQYETNQKKWNLPKLK